MPKSNQPCYYNIIDACVHEFENNSDCIESANTMARKVMAV